MIMEVALVVVVIVIVAVPNGLLTGLWVFRYLKQTFKYLRRKPKNIKNKCGRRIWPGILNDCILVKKHQKHIEKKQIVDGCIEQIQKRSLLV